MRSTTGIAGYTSCVSSVRMGGAVANFLQTRPPCLVTGQLCAERTLRGLDCADVSGVRPWPQRAGGFGDGLPVETIMCASPLLPASPFGNPPDRLHKDGILGLRRSRKL